MKNLKLTLFSIAMVLMVFTSCSNEETIVDNQQTTEDSPSITTSLNRLSTQFDQNGDLNIEANTSGNIVFDFCFDFVYPLDLSYNNGVTVTVNDLDGLIELMISSTDELYINGIAFPFNVETYNESTNAIEIVTINNEEEFATLVEGCAFDDFETCECFEDYNPVCVEVSDPNGETFTITYPNACYAECDGFTEDDFAENCEEDYYSSGSECFTLNYPLSVIINDETITVNSEEELGTVLYDAYNFDFVYPFTVTLENEEVATINNAEDIEALLEDCYDDYNGNDDCIECENTPVDPVCIEYTDEEGNTIVTVFPNMCYAECAGFTLNNVVVCEDDNNPSNCSEEDLANALVECVWFGSSSLNPNNNSGLFNFNADGTVSVSIEGETITGTWNLTDNPSTGDVFMSVTLPAPYEAVSNLDWTVTECSEEFIGLESNNEVLGFERQCN